MMLVRGLSRRSAPRAAYALAGVLLLATANPAFAHHLEKHFTVASHPIVTIHNPSGTITVKSWPKQEIAVSADHLSEKVEVEAEQPTQKRRRSLPRKLHRPFRLRFSTVAR